MRTILVIAYALGPNRINIWWVQSGFPPYSTWNTSFFTSLPLTSSIYSMPSVLNKVSRSVNSHQRCHTALQVRRWDDSCWIWSFWDWRPFFPSFFPLVRLFSWWVLNRLFWISAMNIDYPRINCLKYSPGYFHSNVVFAMPIGHRTSGHCTTSLTKS